MSSVLIVKLEAPGYSSDGIVKAFREHYDEVYEYDWQKIRFNLGVEEMRKRLMGMALMYHPELIFLHVQNPDVLDQNTVEFLSEEIGYTVLYTFDVREDIQWMKDLSPYLDLILFGDHQSVEQCRCEGINNVDYLQSSCDFDFYKPVQHYSSSPEPEIVFIGNNTLNTNLKFPEAKGRVEMVEFMKKEFGNRFAVYGMGWEGTKMVTPREERVIYNCSKIVITHNQFNRDGYTSDRIWRAMSCGVCTISQYYEGYTKDFPSEAWLFWGHLHSLRLACSVLLADEKTRIKMASLQHDHVTQNHTWSKRILKLKELISTHGKHNRVEDIAERATGG